MPERIEVEIFSSGKRISNQNEDCCKKQVVERLESVRMLAITKTSTEKESTMTIEPKEIAPAEFAAAVAHYYGDNDLDAAANGFFKSCALALIRCHQSGDAIVAPISLVSE